MGGHPQNYELVCDHFFFKGTRQKILSGTKTFPRAALGMFDAVASWWICPSVWWVTAGEVSMEVLSWWRCKLARVPTCVHLNRRLMALLKGPSCSGPLVHKPHLRAERLSSASVQLPPGATCTQSHARDPR